jgi:hypothetical protein
MLCRFSGAPKRRHRHRAIRFSVECRAEFKAGLRAGLRFLMYQSSYQSPVEILP